MSRNPSGSLPSGQQYHDLLAEFMDMLWELDCKTKKKFRSAVDVEAEAAMLGPRTTEPASAKSPAGGDETPAGSGAGASPQEEGKTEDPPEADSPETSGSIDGQGGGTTDKTKDDAACKANGDTTPFQPSLYPPRPEKWMHWLTLTFCLFGRPSKSEATDLATAKAGSGPSGDRKKRKESSSTSNDSSDGDSTDGGSGKASGDAGKLSAAGMKHFVGAGETQSRASVKRKLAKEAAKESAEAARNEALRLAREQTALSKEVAQAVKNVAADVRLGRELDQEEACLKRKRAKIEDLKGELALLDPDFDVDRYEEVKADLKQVYRTPPSNFKPDQSTLSDTSTVATPAASSSATLPASSIATSPSSAVMTPAASSTLPVPPAASPSVASTTVSSTTAAGAATAAATTVAATTAEATTAPTTTASRSAAPTTVPIPALPGFSGGGGGSSSAGTNLSGDTTLRRSGRGHRRGAGGAANPVRV